MAEATIAEITKKTMRIRDPQKQELLYDRRGKLYGVKISVLGPGSNIIAWEKWTREIVPIGGNGSSKIIYYYSTNDLSCRPQGEPIPFEYIPEDIQPILKIIL